MSVERRATCARCFVYGDVRSIESTLESFDAWRNPGNPASRVASIVLAGEAVNVLATAQGIRDIELLRGEPFGFALAACSKSAARTLRIGCTTVASPPAGARCTLVLMDADDVMESTPAGRRALATVTSARTGRRNATQTVVILRHGARLASVLARAIQDGGAAIDLVRYDGHNPFLLAGVEGLVTDARPDRILVGGRGARVVGAAIGAGDYFLEHAGDPSRLSDRERASLVGRAVCVRSFTADATDLDTELDAAVQLAGLGVALVTGTFDANASGVLVYPLEGS